MSGYLWWMVDGGWLVVGGGVVLPAGLLDAACPLRPACPAQAVRPASLRTNFIGLWDADFIFYHFILFLNVQLNNIYWLVA